MLALLAVVGTLASPHLPTGGDSWPGWRGPHGNGVAEGSPPIEWSEERNVRWKTPIPGKGLSSPVVIDDRVFITTAVPTGVGDAQPEPPEGESGGRGGRGGRRGGRGGRLAPLVEQDFLVIAFDRADGTVVWESLARTSTPHESTHNDGSFATPTIVSDGELLFASFGSGGIFAYDLEGELLWEVDLGDMNIARSFGEGASPLVHDGKLFVTWEHEGDSFVVALDSESGDELWRKERPQGTNWASPVLVEGEEGPQVVVIGSRTVAYSLDDGAEIWSLGKAPEEAAGESEGGRRGGRRGGGGNGVISSPVQHAGLLLVSTGSRGGVLRALRLEGMKGELDDQTAVVWTHEGDTPHVPSPIAYDGIFYALKGNSGVLTALDANTGELVYGPVRLDTATNIYASPVAADGRLYFAGRDGQIDVIAAGPELEVLATNSLDDGFDASPAIVGDELFLRGMKNLYCIAADE